jgi:CDP-glycerol glycerophosphotransferase
MSRELPLDKLSVLVTCYNKREYVEPCFRFLNELSVIGAEVVIIDDGSTDGSSALIEKQISQMSRKPVLRTTENRGLAAARDLAIETAKSEFVYCLDIDDTPNIKTLAEIVEQLSSSTASACAGNFWYLDQNAP